MCVYVFTCVFINPSMLETFFLCHSLYKLLNLTHTNIVSVYHYMECSGKPRVRSTFILLWFLQE